MIRLVLSESEMSQHWFEASVVSSLKSLGFVGEGKHVDKNNITHFIFSKEFPDGEGFFAITITKGAFEFMVKLKAYSMAGDEKKTLFHKTMKKPSDLYKIKIIMEDYLNEVGLSKLGVKLDKTQVTSKSDISDLIDIALDKKDFKEVDRLSKLL
jgi:hypothetical protein